MANWKYKLRVKDGFEKCHGGTLSVNELAKIVADKLKAFTFPERLSTAKEDLDGIIEEFEYFHDYGCYDKDDFDNIMELLYDWADQEIAPVRWPPNKLCWIETF